MVLVSWRREDHRARSTVAGRLLHPERACLHDGPHDAAREVLLPDLCRSTLPGRAEFDEHAGQVPVQPIDRDLPGVDRLEGHGDCAGSVVGRNSGFEPLTHR